MILDAKRELCKCGHDRTTHHEGKYNCLGMFCNNCHVYKNEWEEDGPVTPRAPDSNRCEDPPDASWMMPQHTSWPKGWP